MQVYVTIYILTHIHMNLRTEQIQMSRFLEFVHDIRTTTAPHLGAGETTSFFIPREGPDCRCGVRWLYGV